MKSFLLILVLILVGPASFAAEKVTGIGGFFFKARDPKALAKWYETHLGINKVPTSYEEPVWEQEKGPTVFAPFSQKTTYFGAKDWMLNLRVRNLDAMAKQLQAAGIKVAVDPKKYRNGVFAQLEDPEGNPIQLWEPQNNPNAKE